jgi:hypothetical protein
MGKIEIDTFGKGSANNSREEFLNSWESSSQGQIEKGFRELDPERVQTQERTGKDNYEWRRVDVLSLVRG